MSKRVAIVALLFVIGCGGGSEKGPGGISREPVSVRGWIVDVERPGEPGNFKTVETEAARRIEMFQQTSVWIDGAPFVSGGVGETGSFVLLDVPPGDVTISFSAPGVQNCKLVLKNAPGNSDIFIPGLLLTTTNAKLTQPEDVKVRVAGTQNRPTGRTASVAGQNIPVTEVPLNAMMDRRDYPDAGAKAPLQPVATVK